MFLDFFYALRRHRVPVSPTEWLTLMQALQQGLAQASLARFYTLARAILVKDVGYYDAYDLAFRETFQGIETPAPLLEALLAWLDAPHAAALAPPGSAAAALAQLRQLLAARRQREQPGGGERLLGSGGTAPLGHGGQHARGVRLGGEGGQGSAVQVAAARRFENYRHDRTLDVRQLQVALKKLRHLQRLGAQEELALEETVAETCRRGGEIELVFRPPRRNSAKVLLLMDAGGSMSPYTPLVERLFSAAHQARHFRAFQYYYFHNCVYDWLYRDMARRQRVATAAVLRACGADYKLLLVGDAYMAPEELLEPGGALYAFEPNATPGLAWLQRLRQHFHAAVWLNPMPAQAWHHPTIARIRQLFPMYELTLQGLEAGIKELVRRRP
ncbi:MAG: hypothetical protein KatS3mg131_3825 [Candidatus Tectimicrobiota bacterium]|nr:MAG: hypothetical protein KatS3mg131_3825 [Candidatus Tectomicrobia bacterium]